MSVWQALLLGLVQGITEFVPVSSSGHVVLLRQLMHMDGRNNVLFEAVLHLGTLLTVLFVFRSDIKRLFWELIHIMHDIFDNLKIWLRNRKHPEPSRYHKLLSTNYRRFAVLILVSSVPTGVIGYLIRGMAETASANLLAPAIGFFITAILLMVTECAVGEREKSPRDTKYSEAAVIGVFQGLAVFPGISRAGATLSACFLCGFSRKYAIKYSYIMSIPAVIGAFAVEVREAGPVSGASEAGICLLALLTAAVAGYFSIRLMLRLITQHKLRYFSVYCILIGVVSVTAHFMM